MARKAKKVFSRKARTGIAAAPTTSFHAFNDYIRVDVDRKEIASVIKTYIRKQFHNLLLHHSSSSPMALILLIRSLFKRKKSPRARVILSF